tara:strand:+ start:338 stop:2344 length:2007 start_codon:yes stop_codon:yes gene_type:complete
MFKIRNITKSLAVMEDLAVGRGTVLQKRGTGNKVDIHIVVESVEALTSVDTSVYTRARVYSGASYIDYVYLNEVWQSLADNSTLALKIFQSPTNGGLTKIQTRTVDAGDVYEVRKTSDDSLATIYSDAASPTEIVQNGTDNKSGSDGVVEFYITGGGYYIEVGSVKSNFDVQALIMGDRKRTSAVFAATMLDGTIFTMAGLQYLVDSSAIGPDSCTNDLGVDGILPFGTVYPQHFGAVADGSITDDRVAIQRAIDYAYSTGGMVSLRSLSYRIDDRVVAKGAFDGSNATINVYGSPAVAFDISTGNGDDPTDLLSLSGTVEIIVPNLVNKTKPITGWEGQGIGCRVHNVNNARVLGQVIREFAVGLKLSGKSQGCAYGSARDFFFLNNQRNFETEQLDDTGWVTEWTVQDSRFFHYSAEGSGIVGTRHVNIIPHPIANVVNNIRFYNPCMEGNTAEYHMYLGGNYIQFYGARFENVGGARVHLASEGVPGQGSSNQIIGGRGVDFSKFKFSSDPGVRDRFTINGSDGTDLSMRGGATLLRNTSGSGAGSSLLTGFSATTTVLSDGFDASSQYSWNLYAEGMDAKRETDAYPRMSLSFNSASILLGNGSAAPVGGMVAVANAGVDLVSPYLPTVTTNPPNLSGRAAIWFDGVSIKIRLPDGTIKTILTQ